MYDIMQIIIGIIVGIGGIAIVIVVEPKLNQMEDTPFITQVVTFCGAIAGVVVAIAGGVVFCIGLRTLII